MKGKKKEPEITVDEWLTAMSKTEIIRERPKNSFTIDDVIKKTGKPYTTAVNYVNNLVKSQKVIKGKFVTENGCVSNYYIPKEFVKEE